MTMAQKQEALQAIRASHSGQLSPELMVEEARNPLNPFHNEFDWNDQSLAHQARLARARAIITSVEISIRVDNRTITSVCYVHDPNAQNGEQGYVALTEIKRQSQDAYAILNAELERIESIVQRGCNIAAVLGMTKDFDELLARVVAIRTKAARRKRQPQTTSVNS